MMAKGAVNSSSEETVAELRAEIETLKEKLAEEKQKLNDVECKKFGLIYNFLISDVDHNCFSDNCSCKTRSCDEFEYESSEVTQGSSR